MSDQKQPVGTLPVYQIIVKGEVIEEIMGGKLSALRELEVQRAQKLTKHQSTRRFVRYETAKPGAF